MSGDTWNQFCSDTQILCEFTPDTNAGSWTDASVLKNTGWHKIYEFLIACSWLRTLVKKALYRFNTLDLIQVRLVSRKSWMHVSLCYCISQTKNYLSKQILKKKCIWGQEEVVGDISPFCNDFWCKRTVCEELCCSPYLCFLPFNYREGWNSSTLNLKVLVSSLPTLRTCWHTWYRSLLDRGCWARWPTSFTQWDNSFVSL